MRVMRGLGVDYLPEHLKPMLTLDHIEMGNLEAKEKLNKV